MLHVLFINIVVCKDQTDNLLQVFNIVRLQVAQKLCIQRRFKRGVCVSVFRWFCRVQVPRFCKSVVGVSVLGTEGAGGSVLGTGGGVNGKDERHCQKSQWQTTLVPPLIFIFVPQQFFHVESKEPSRPPHRQRADFREVVKHRLNFRIRITPTDF